MSMFRRNSTTMPEKTVQLPLAPMADVFIVILIFILKSLASDPGALAPNNTVSLPTANGQSEAQATEYRIDISKDSLSLNEQSLVTLSNYRFRKEDLDEKGLPKGLQETLQKKLQGQSGAVAQANPMTVYADKEAPYDTVRTVLSIAADSGYSRLQIAVAGDR